MKSALLIVLAVLVSASAMAAQIDAEAVGKADLEKSRQHRAELDDKRRDIEALKAEVRKLRADVEMCRAGVDRKRAASAPGR